MLSKSKSYFFSPRNSEFQLIHELCLYVLSASQRTELIRATLATLHAFLSWIPLGYIFESPLVTPISLLHIFINAYILYSEISCMFIFVIEVQVILISLCVFDAMLA